MIIPLVLGIILIAQNVQAAELTGIARLQAIHCGNKHNPCPPLPPPQPPLSLIITFNPSLPQLTDTTEPGTVVASIHVSRSDGLPFTGSLGFGLPYGNDGGFYALMGNDIVQIFSVPVGYSVQHLTVVATQ